MSVDDLKDVCRKFAISNYSGKAKSELVDLIWNTRKGEKSLKESSKKRKASVEVAELKVAKVITQEKDYIGIAKAEQEVQNAIQKLAIKKIELRKALQDVEKAETALLAKQEKLKKAQIRKKTVVKSFVVSDLIGPSFTWK